MSNLQEQVYIDYLNYDWDSFTEFQDGLQQILDSFLDNLKQQDASVTSIPALDKQQLIEQAKSFFYCSHTGEILNLDDYLDWKRVNGHKFDKNRKIIELDEPEVESITPAVASSTDNITLNEPAEFEIAPSATEGKADAPPYSSNYQDLVELIVSGKPVPGIKTIPDTVVPEKSSKSAANQRLKPWEKSG